MKARGARIPVRGGLCCGVEGSAVLWSLWSPLGSLASAVGTWNPSCLPLQKSGILATYSLDWSFDDLLVLRILHVLPVLLVLLLLVLLL